MRSRLLLFFLLATNGLSAQYNIVDTVFSKNHIPLIRKETFADYGYVCQNDVYSAAYRLTNISGKSIFLEDVIPDVGLSGGTLSVGYYIKDSVLPGQSKFLSLSLKAIKPGRFKRSATVVVRINGKIEEFNLVMDGAVQVCDPHKGRIDTLRDYNNTANNIPVLRYVSMYDAGEICMKDPYSHDYELTNISDKPIRIIDVRGSCGCVVFSWKRNDTIMPGQSTYIKGTLDTESPGEYNKTGTVAIRYGDTDLLFIIAMKGRVVATDLYVEQNYYEWVRTEGKYSHKFSLINWGSHEVIIDSVLPDKSNTAYTLSKKSLMPGDTAYMSVDLELQPKWYHSEASFTIYYHSKEKQNCAFQNAYVRYSVTKKD
jgi:hypothetical protein